MPMYTTKLTFKGLSLEVGIQPVGSDGFDLEIRSRHSLSGEYFQALRKYLIDEGYVDAAKNWHKPDFAS